MTHSTDDISRTVGTLIAGDDCVHPSVRVKKAIEKFYESPQLDALAVVEGREAIGLLTRPKLLFSVFRRYGFELYGKKPVIMLADTEPLSVCENEPLESAIEKALARRTQDVYDELIVTDGDGRYKGLLPVRRMILQQSTLLASSIVQKEMASGRAKELEKVNRVKSQFIANVTHELRSPVNAIIGLAELMRMSCEKGRMDMVRNRLSLITSGAVHLRAIITNILDLSKIEAGRMEIIHEEFDILGIAEETAETTKVLLGSKPVEVHIDDAGCASRVVTSDPTKIRQIMINLMSNAAKFTERGKITLTIQTSGDGLVVKVADTGPGIKKEEQENLFTAFSQAGDVATKRHEGTGLGLAITRSLVGMLGGRITLQSQFGSGTTFEATIPINDQGGKNT